jgi:LmbE family N-acetylglucosaminyl deacetylase
MLILFLLLIIPILIWLYGFFLLSDFTIKNADISQFKKVLFIYPHADDELFNCGGLIQKLDQSKIPTILCVLTKGEKGTPDGSLKNELKIIREKELRKVAEILHISEIISEDFGDGELINREKELQVYIDTLIQKTQPDLVITYDMSGMYGHNDHIITSQITTRIIEKKYPHITLWYSTMLERVLNKIKLPIHMATDKEFLKKRTTPTVKLFLGIKSIGKIRGFYTYKSQNLGEAVKPLPGWFYLSFAQFEYFHEVTKKKLQRPL